MRLGARGATHNTSTDIWLDIYFEPKSQRVSVLNISVKQLPE